MNSPMTGAFFLNAAICTFNAWVFLHKRSPLNGALVVATGWMTAFCLVTAAVVGP